MYVWGYIPVVVAKCGLYLKEKATETEGIFRINGSAKRMRDLQVVFQTPPRYGKNIDWKAETFTNHDVATLFRRYLVKMPEPVVPSHLYHEFRAIYRSTKKAEEVIQEYKRLIKSMPRPNQYLLLYVLDLLSVFARKADKNFMTASNLAVIFRPGILAHKDHELAPDENELSTQVLEFLIDHQDWFMLDIPPLPQSETDSMKTNNTRGHGGASSTAALPLPSQQVNTASHVGGTVSSTHANANDEYDTDINVGPSSDDDQRDQRHDSPVRGGWKLIHRRTKKEKEKDRERRSEDLSRGRGKGNNDAKSSGWGVGIGRSKSQVDHSSSTSSRRPPRKASSGDGLSPVHELSGPPLDIDNGNTAGAGAGIGEMGEDVVLGGSGGASVGRSRTLPSGSTKSRSSAPGAGSGSEEKEPKEKDKEREREKPKVLKKKKDQRRPFSLVPPPKA